MPIYVTKPSVPRIEDYIEEIKPIFESHIMTNMGPIYKKFQHQLIDFLDVKYLSLFVNGHSALELAIEAMGLRKEGGEVITTPFTFISTTHAIVRNGLKPVFCDIKPDDFTMDPQKIEELITDKTVAIIPVHVYGNICDVEEIERIAKEHNLKVIYDAAHAFGETYKGIPVGKFGDASMFSFHATKSFNSIEGGAIAFDNAEYRIPLHELKNFGIHDENDVISVGGNAKMNEFAAAMGICNLKRFEDSVKARKMVSDHYDERLKDVPGIRSCRNKNDISHNYAYYAVYFDREIFGRSRDQINGMLRENDIFPRKYFYPAVNNASCYKGKYNETPISTDASLNILTLPIYEGLELETVDRICDLILEK